MFYLKYRPKRFSEVMGISSIIQTLQKFLTQKNLPHAYLFTGPRGSGKTTTARLLAKAINCVNPSQTEVGIEVCDECHSCRQISEGRFLDLIEIDAASNRGIDDIRSLREKVKLSPSSGKFKVYIIDEAHMLTIEAFNALLKTLEEPPLHAIFILATTEPQKIPETIRSRCHVFNFKRADRQSLISKMELILRSEGIEMEKGKLEEIARLSGGGFRDAETLLEQVAAGFTDFASRDLDPDSFVEILSLRDLPGALDFIGRLHEEGVDLSTFTQDLLYFLRDLLLIKAGVKKENLPESFLFDEASAQAEHFTVQEIYEAISAFVKANQDFKIVPIPQLALEMAVIRLLNKTGPGSGQLPVDTTSLPLGIGGGGEGAVVDPEAQNPVGKNEMIEGIPSTTPISLELVTLNWPQILKEIKILNHSLEALLRSARPKETSSQTLIIEVFYKFHKDKLSARANLDILENVFQRVLNRPLKVQCILGQMENKIEGDSATVSDEDIKTAALKAFIGE